MFFQSEPQQRMLGYPPNGSFLGEEGGSYHIAPKARQYIPGIQVVYPAIWVITCYHLFGEFVSTPQNVHTKNDLVGAQPPTNCSFARHLVGKIAIFCSFAHH